MYNNEQADELFNQETIEQPQTIIFNKLTGALVAKMFGDHLDLVNTICNTMDEIFKLTSSEYARMLGISNEALRSRRRRGQEEEGSQGQEVMMS